MAPNVRVRTEPIVLSPQPETEPRHGIWPEEWIFIGFVAALLALIGWSGIGYVSVTDVFTSPALIGATLLGLAAVYLVAYRRAPRPDGWLDPARAQAAAGEAASALRATVPMLACLASYATLRDLTPALRKHVVDGALVSFDHAVFGRDVSLWLDHAIGSPVMTAIMLFCYLSYGSAQAVYALTQHFRHRRAAFHDFSLAIAISAVLGYAGYLTVPAVGPHLYETSLFTRPLPGYGDHPLGGIIDAVTDVQGHARDAFPSLHTALTVVLMMCLWREARKAFWWYAPLGCGLIVATMYLRVHYGADVVAGIALGAASVWASRWFNGRTYGIGSDGPG